MRVDAGSLEYIESFSQPEHRKNSKNNKTVLTSLLATGSWLWTGTVEGDIVIWDSEFGDVVSVLTGHEDAVTTLVSIDDQVWSADVASTLCIWFLDQHEAHPSVQLHTNEPCFKLLRVGTSVWSFQDSCVQIVDIDSQQIVEEFDTGDTSIVAL